MQAHRPLLLLLVTLACGPGAADQAADPGPASGAVAFSLVDGPAEAAAPAREPLASLPGGLARQRDGWINVQPGPAHPDQAAPPEVTVGLSNTPAPALHLGWIGRGSDGPLDGRRVWHEADRELPFLPTALATHDLDDERFYLAGWDAGQDRVLVQACRLEVGAWLDEAGAPGHDGPPITRRTIWRSEPGEGALVKALACHPLAGRLVLLSGGDCPALWSLDLAGDTPVPLGIDCDDEPFLGRVETLRGGLLAGPPGVAGAFAIVGDETIRRRHDHPLHVVCGSAGCRDLSDDNCMPLPMQGWLLMLDEGADGRFEQLQSYGDATYHNLALRWVTARDSRRP